MHAVSVLILTAVAVFSNVNLVAAVPLKLSAVDVVDAFDVVDAVDVAIDVAKHPQNKDTDVQVVFEELHANNIYINILGDVDGLLRPTNRPTPEPTPETTPDSTPEPTPVPSEATTTTLQPSPETTPETTPEPTPLTTPESTAEPTPDSSNSSSCINDHLPGFGYYKLHTEVADWRVAVETCYREGGHLLVLRSTAEYDAVFAKYGAPDGIKIHYGAHNVRGSFKTIFGEPLEKTGYYTWLFDHEPTPSPNYPALMLYLNPRERGTGLEDAEEGPGYTMTYICKRFLLG